MARKSIRDGVVGRVVAVNDDQGNGFEGAVFGWDDSAMLLVSTGSERVKFHERGADKPLEMDQAVIPAARVVFVVPRPG